MVNQAWTSFLAGVRRLIILVSWTTDQFEEEHKYEDYSSID